LQKLDVAFNSLADLDFLNDLDTKKLTSINITKNNFSNQSVQDLYSSSLNKFESLEELDLSVNKFYGSLKPLEDLTNLKNLTIGNTDIDSGLECLPNSLERIYLFDSSRFGSNCEGEKTKKSTQFFNKELAPFKGHMKD